jgi:histone arginine demethylase JMJD6
LYHRFKDARVKIGEDDDGYKIKVYFKYYLEYLMYNKDDSPLYLFESSIENNKYLKDVIPEYEVPKYFKEDLFALVICNYL